MAHTNVQLVSGNLTTGQASPTFFIDRVNDTVGIGGVPDITGDTSSNVLQVTGNMLATRYHGDGSNLTGLNDSKWLEYSGDASKIYYNGGNVGIGVDNPGSKLDVNGTVTATTFSGALSGNATSASSAGYASSAGSATNQSGGTVSATTGTFSGSIQAGYNTNTISYFGRSAVGYVGHNDWAGFAHIDSNSGSNYALLQNSSGQTLLNCSNSESIRFRSGNSDKCVITNDGIVGIGYTTYLGKKLAVNGKIVHHGIQQLSDDRIKYNETDIGNPLTLINKIKPQKYEKISESPSDTGAGTWIPTDEEWESVKSTHAHEDEYGFIAQDIRKIPELSFLVSGEETRTDTKNVSLDEYSNLTTVEQQTYTQTIDGYTKQIESQTPLSLNYQGLSVLATAALQEVDRQLQAERARNDSLEARILALENK
jgi:hypothetical protein